MPDVPPLLAAGLQDRLVLLLNHLLGREPAASERLRPLAGQSLTVTLDGQPGWAPQLPPLHLAVTPAGLFERIEAPAQPQLHIAIDGRNPLQLALGALQGERRGVTVSGEVPMASSVNWLFENLRWDLGDELARVVGPAPARLLEQAAGAARAAIGKLLSPRDAKP
jgi:ubiquinone biosynthesis accessory factor UbiJ